MNYVNNAINWKIVLHAKIQNLNRSALLMIRGRVSTTNMSMSQSFMNQ